MTQLKYDNALTETCDNATIEMRNNIIKTRKNDIITNLIEIHNNDIINMQIISLLLFHSLNM